MMSSSQSTARSRGLVGLSDAMTVDLMPRLGLKGEAWCAAGAPKLPEYAFPIFRWMDERVRPESLTLKVKAGFKTVLGELQQWAESVAAQTGAVLELEKNPRKAVKKADALYTDVWVSMGKETQSAERLKALANYQINRALVKLAKPSLLGTLMSEHGTDSKEFMDRLPGLKIMLDEGP